MTNYNERLDEILNTLGERHIMVEHRLIHLDMPEQNGKNIETRKAKQTITSLIKELVMGAKPYRETIIDKWNKDRADEVKATNAAMNAWADIFEQNLLKALEEK